MLNMRADQGRRSGVRVRTACVTCKIRRVKCDEAKPACRKCTLTGRKCDGYSFTSPRNKDAFKQALTERSNEVVKTGLETTSFYALPFKIPGSQTERQLFHYFCVHATRDLAGFSNVNSRFWSQVVLQSSHHEPVVRSALIALASVHRKFATGEEVGVAELANPLQEYNKAIRRLRRHIETKEYPNRNVVLICCALFFCFDSARGEFAWALNHLENGLNILKKCTTDEGNSELRNGDSSSNEQRALNEASEDDLETITHFFAQLDVQASNFESTRTPYMPTLRNGPSGFTNLVPSTFANLFEVEDSLNKITNRMTYFLTAHRKFGVEYYSLPDSIREQQFLLKQLQLWDTVFAQFWEKPKSVMDRDETRNFENCVSMIKVHRIVFEVALMTPSGKLGHYDPLKMSDAFKTSIDEIERVLNRQTRASSPSLRRFSSTPNVVLCLFFMAVRCSDPEVRDRATSILDRSMLREGLWDAKMMAGIVKGIMKIERAEQNFPKDGTTSVEQWGMSYLDSAEGFHNLAKTLDALTVDGDDAETKLESESTATCAMMHLPNFVEDDACE